MESFAASYLFIFPSAFEVGIEGLLCQEVDGGHS